MKLEGQRSETAIGKNTCRRDQILQELLLLVKQIEEWDKRPIASDSHYQAGIGVVQYRQQGEHHHQQGEHHHQQGEHHHQQGEHHHQQGEHHHQQGEHPQQQGEHHPTSCCCGAEDFSKDEYYQPATLGGGPARPVLTRPAGHKLIKWCPPCFKIVPTMDYTLCCYQSPEMLLMKKQEEPWRTDVHIVDGMDRTHQPQNVPHLLDNYQKSQEMQNKVAHDIEALKHGERYQAPYQEQHYEVGNKGAYPEYCNDPMKQGEKYHAPFQGQNYGVGNQIPHPGQYNAQQPVKHVETHKNLTTYREPHQAMENKDHHYVQHTPNQFEQRGHSSNQMQEPQRPNKCIYNPYLDSLRRVTCEMDMQMQQHGQKQPYSGRPQTYQGHQWEGSDGHMHHKEMDKQQQTGKPQEQREKAHYPALTPTPESRNLHGPEHGKEHILYERGRTNEPKHQPGSYPKTVVLLKPMEPSKDHHDPRREHEPKYYPVLIPKDVIWPKPTDVPKGVTNMPIGASASRYTTVLIPNEVIWPKPNEQSKHHIETKPSQFDQSRYNQPMVPYVAITDSRPRENLKPHTENYPSSGGIQERHERCCRKVQDSRAAGDGQCQPPKEMLGNSQRRNGLIEQPKEAKKGPQAASIVCYEDRLRKEKAAARDWDIFGGQNCNHVHPPSVYFTYPCPENDRKHNHWSAPETTICRYPNTCLASCFDHPVFNNWISQQPSYRYYMQNRSYSPF